MPLRTQWSVPSLGKCLHPARGEIVPVLRIEFQGVYNFTLPAEAVAIHAKTATAEFGVSASIFHFKQVRVIHCVQPVWALAPVQRENRG